MSLKQRILTISESAERNHFFELRAIAMEVRKMEDRVNQLDEELERTKQDRNAIAKTVREPLLLKLDHANDHIKRLEEALDLVRPHCDSVHHSKKHQHQYGEPCPVVALIENVKEAKL